MLRHVNIILQQTIINNKKCAGAYNNLVKFKTNKVIFKKGELVVDNLITKELIILDMEASSKEEVIKKLSKVIEAQYKLIDYDGYVRQVFEREKTFPTSIGFDVAIPHGKCDSVRHAALAFARLKNEVQWSEEEKAKYVFLIAVPEKEAGNTHLQILAQLSRKIMREEFREKLQEASEIEEILEVLSS